MVFTVLVMISRTTSQVVETVKPIYVNLYIVVLNIQSEYAFTFEKKTMFYQKRKTFTSWLSSQLYARFRGHVTQRASNGNLVTLSDLL